MVSDSEEEAGLGLFEEPQDFYKPEAEATFASHTMHNGTNLKIRLIGHNPLWGHHLWNAGRVISHYLEDNRETLIHGKTVLELGAGGGLPSLVCAITGAKQVVVTDYPDVELIDNLRDNIKQQYGLFANPNIKAEGYLWGSTSQATKILSHLPPSTSPPGFDILILADLLFNHSEHPKLIQSIQQTLSKTKESLALVFFTPYRPWLLEKDLNFFELAEKNGFVVKRFLQNLMDRVMFVEDPGDEILRRTVYGYELRWKESELLSVN